MEISELTHVQQESILFIESMKVNRLDSRANALIQHGSAHAMHSSVSCLWISRSDYIFGRDMQTEIAHAQYLGHKSTHVH